MVKASLWTVQDFTGKAIDLTFWGKSRQKVNILIYHNPLNWHIVFLVKKNDIIHGKIV